MVIIDPLTVIRYASEVPPNFLDMNPLVTLGAGAAALLAIINLITKVATVIAQNNEQTRTLNKLNDSMLKMGDNFMTMQQDRQRSIEKLDRTDRDLQALRRETDEKTSRLNRAVDNIRKDIAEIKEILENQTKGGN